MIYFTVLTILIIALDQITKYLAAEYLAPIREAVVIPGVLNFTYVENRGAAFGILANHRYIFIILSIIGIAALVFYYFRFKPDCILLKTAFIFICAGGCGNMIDRLFRGYVVDFINVTCISFYVFNIADSFVCIGCAMFILYILTDAYKEKKKAAEKKTGGTSETANKADDSAAHNAVCEDAPSDLYSNATAEEGSPEQHSADKNKDSKGEAL